jgi:hypothetical protein
LFLLSRRNALLCDQLAYSALSAHPHSLGLTGKKGKLRASALLGKGNTGYTGNTGNTGGVGGGVYYRDRGRQPIRCVR